MSVRFHTFTDTSLSVSDRNVVKPTTPLPSPSPFPSQTPSSLS